MRKVILGLGVSLDMYIARPDGAVDFLFLPNDYLMTEFFAGVDTAAFGRKTLDAALKMSNGASFGDSIAMYVFSRTRPAGKRGEFTFVDQSPETFVKRLRKKPGKNIWLMGGGELTREFLQADLVDELHLGLIPVLLGEGIPLFPSGFPQRDFTLIENKSYSLGLVVLKYERTRPVPKSKRVRQQRAPS